MRRPVLASAAAMVALFVVAGGLGVAAKPGKDCPRGVCTVVVRTTETVLTTRVTTIPVTTLTTAARTKTRVVRSGVTTVQGGTVEEVTTEVGPPSTTTLATTDTQHETVHDTVTSRTTTVTTRAVVSTSTTTSTVEETETATQYANTFVYCTDIFGAGYMLCNDLGGV